MFIREYQLLLGNTNSYWVLLVKLTENIIDLFLHNKNIDDTSCCLNWKNKLELLVIHKI